MAVKKVKHGELHPLPPPQKKPKKEGGVATFSPELSSFQPANFFNSFDEEKRTIYWKEERGVKGQPSSLE